MGLAMSVGACGGGHDEVPRLEASPARVAAFTPGPDGSPGIEVVNGVDPGDACVPSESSVTNGVNGDMRVAFDSCTSAYDYVSSMTIDANELGAVNDSISALNSCLTSARCSLAADGTVSAGSATDPTCADVLSKHVNDGASDMTPAAARVTANRCGDGGGTSVCVVGQAGVTGAVVFGPKSLAMAGDTCAHPETWWDIARSAYGFGTNAASGVQAMGKKLVELTCDLVGATNADFIQRVTQYLAAYGTLFSMGSSLATDGGLVKLVTGVTTIAAQNGGAGCGAFAPPDSYEVVNLPQAEIDDPVNGTVMDNSLSNLFALAYVTRAAWPADKSPSSGGPVLSTYDNTYGAAVLIGDGGAGGAGGDGGFTGNATLSGHSPWPAGSVWAAVQASSPRVKAFPLGTIVLNGITSTVWATDPCCKI
jgi:hypothetical protein